MPTGVHLHDARQLLFEAAERVIGRDGIAGLTSRSVTGEAGVSKGVLHRYFADFDAFVAELLVDRAAKLDPFPSEAAGTGTVVKNVTKALEQVFTPLAMTELALVITCEGVRDRLRAVGAARLPLVTGGCESIATYLSDEQASGRLAPNADIPALAHTLVGAAHLLITDHANDSATDTRALEKVVANVVGPSLL